MSEKTKKTEETQPVESQEKTSESPVDVKTVEPKDLKKDDLILDIRSYMQHAKTALSRPHWHISAEDLNPKRFIKDYHLDGSKTLHIVCNRGRKSIEMAQEFIAAGYKNVASVAGGMMHAKESGLPMIDHPVWDMQRQIRFAAGLIVFVGTFLGWTLGDVFYLIPLLAGAGLMFSGATGKCYLEKMLDKMPWNE